MNDVHYLQRILFIYSLNTNISTGVFIKEIQGDSCPDIVRYFINIVIFIWQQFLLAPSQNTLLMLLVNIIARSLSDY